MASVIATLAVDHELALRGVQLGAVDHRQGQGEIGRVPGLQGNLPSALARRQPQRLIVENAVGVGPGGRIVAVKVGENGKLFGSVTSNDVLEGLKAKGVEIDPENPMTWGKVPRNAQCPCGSGKKYKHCHGAFS